MLPRVPCAGLKEGAGGQVEMQRAALSFQAGHFEDLHHDVPRRAQEALEDLELFILLILHKVQAPEGRLLIPI